MPSPIKQNIFIFLLLNSFFATQIQAQSKKITMPTKGICAHRGGADNRPENTIPAFKHAIELGVQMIEFDIHFSKDSVLVIMHDDSVDRTTDGTGNVSNLTLAQLQKLDAGIKKGAAYKGAHVPTLEETLAMMPRNIWLNCHLKGGAELGKAVANVIAKTKRVHQSMLTGSEEASAAAKQAQPNILICNAENKYRKDNAVYSQATIDMKAQFIQLVVPAANESLVPYIQKLKANNVAINYFWSQDPSELKTLFEQGIDFVLVNDIDAFTPVAVTLGVKPIKPLY